MSCNCEVLISSDAVHCLPASLHMSVKTCFLQLVRQQLSADCILPFMTMLHRVNVDFQKQTVDPVQVSFNKLDRSQTITDILLTVDVTEVRWNWRWAGHLQLSLLQGTGELGFLCWLNGTWK